MQEIIRINMLFKVRKSIFTKKKIPLHWNLTELKWQRR